MFSALENNWDHSPRRRWTTAASFAMQALGLGLLLAIPIITAPPTPGLKRLALAFLSPPSAPAAQAPATRARSTHVFDASEIHMPQAATIQFGSAHQNDNENENDGIPAAPDFNGIGVRGGTNREGQEVPGGLGDRIAVAPPPPSAPAHPLRVSRLGEGSLILRIQPAYPALARQARIQGTVVLRAIVSKDGAIENLTVISGHAMLVAAAIDAVRQWRYRPYLLGNDPVEVETEITVNFTLAGN